MLLLIWKQCTVFGKLFSFFYLQQPVLHLLSKDAVHNFLFFAKLQCATPTNLIIDHTGNIQETMHIMQIILFLHADTLSIWPGLQHDSIQTGLCFTF